MIRVGVNHGAGGRARTQAGRALLAWPASSRSRRCGRVATPVGAGVQPCAETCWLVGPFVAAVALLCALGRLHRALWVNRRYRFTTWRWGRIAAALLLMGVVLKLTMPT